MKILNTSELSSLEFKLVSFTDDAEHHFEKFDDLFCGPRYSSYLAGYATIEAGDIQIKFVWDAMGGSSSYKEAFDFSITLGDSSFWEINAKLVDEDGDELRPSVKDYALREVIESVAWQDKIRNHLPVPDEGSVEGENDQAGDTNGAATPDKGDGSAALEEFIIERDDGPDLKFMGNKIASASSNSHDGPSSSRWTVLKLFRTKSGIFVCQQIGRTCYHGENDRYKARVCRSEKEVMEFFGYGWLAKELYYEAEIDATERVD